MNVHTLDQGFHEHPNSSIPNENRNYGIIWRIYAQIDDILLEMGDILTIDGRYNTLLALNIREYNCEIRSQLLRTQTIRELFLFVETLLITIALLNIYHTRPEEVWGEGTDDEARSKKGFSGKQLVDHEKRKPINNYNSIIFVVQCMWLAI